MAFLDYMKSLGFNRRVRDDEAVEFTDEDGAKLNRGRVEGFKSEYNKTLNKQFAQGIAKDPTKAAELSALFGGRAEQVDSQEGLSGFGDQNIGDFLKAGYIPGSNKEFQNTFSPDGIKNLVATGQIPAGTTGEQLLQMIYPGATRDASGGTRLASPGQQAAFTPTFRSSKSFLQKYAPSIVMALASYGIASGLSGAAAAGTEGAAGGTGLTAGGGSQAGLGLKFAPETLAQTQAAISAGTPFSLATPGGVVGGAASGLGLKRVPETLAQTDLAITGGTPFSLGTPGAPAPAPAPASGGSASGFDLLRAATNIASNFLGGAGGAGIGGQTQSQGPVAPRGFYGLNAGERARDVKTRTRLVGTETLLAPVGEATEVAKRRGRPTLLGR